MTILKSFLAGFFSTLLFHQGVIAIFNLLQVVPFKAYDMTPTQPLGVPSVISLAFFAGIWGVVIWMMIKNRPRKTQLIGAIVLGAILPTIVAFAVVLPLKGIEFKPAYIPFGLLLNGIWGLGLWILMYLMNKAFIRQGTTSMKFIIILSMLSASLIACATISDSGGTKSMAGTRMTCHADQELVASCIATRADGDSKLAMDDAQEVAICRLDNQYLMLLKDVKGEISSGEASKQSRVGGTSYRMKSVSMGNAIVLSVTTDVQSAKTKGIMSFVYDGGPARNATLECN